MNKNIWVACHDTLVCAGAKQIQKWCVREGDEKGPLIAVMLTKEVAHALAAAPDLYEAVKAVIALRHDNRGLVAPMEPHAQAVYGQCVAAIAKAEGK